MSSIDLEKHIYSKRKVLEARLSVLSEECNVMLNAGPTGPSKVKNSQNVTCRDAILCKVSDRIDVQSQEAIAAYIEEIYYERRILFC